MLVNSIISYLHFISAMAVVATLIFERITFSQNLSMSDARRIQKVDAIYGLSSMLVILFGFLRVYYFEKGSGYYFNNTFFWLKMTFFGLTGLLSIYPTIQFLKWRKELKKGETPKMASTQYGLINKLINLEILMLLLAILCASLMAKGIDL